MTRCIISAGFVKIPTRIMCLPITRLRIKKNAGGVDDAKQLAQQATIRPVTAQMGGSQE